MNFETHLSKKENIFWRGFQAAIYLDRKNGHLMWSFSDLARVSKIERSMIYYYFGKSKEEILRDAVQFVGEILFGLYPGLPALWMAGDFLESTRCSRDILQKHPHLRLFYLEQRQKGAPFYSHLTTLEKRYLKKLAGAYPGADAAHLQVFFASMTGAILLPEVDEQTLKKMAKNFKSLLTGTFRHEH